MAMHSTVLVVFLFCCALPLLVSAQGVSKYTHDFLALYNGDFNNQKQVDEPANQNAFIQYRLIPVDAPALGPGPVIYEEWAVNGVVVDMVIGLVSQHPGPSFHMDIYNFTDPSYYTPGQFNVSELHHFTRKELRGGDCTAVYKQLKRPVYVGYYPACSGPRIQGNYLNYGDTFTCDAYSIVFPPTDTTFTTTPSIFNRIGDRHPLIGFPDNFDSICGRHGYPLKPRKKYY